MRTRYEIRYDNDVRRSIVETLLSLFGWQPAIRVDLFAFYFEAAVIGAFGWGLYALLIGRPPKPNV